MDTKKEEVTNCSNQIRALTSWVTFLGRERLVTGSNQAARSISLHKGRAPLGFFSPGSLPPRNIPPTPRRVTEGETPSPFSAVHLGSPGGRRDDTRKLQRHVTGPEMPDEQTDLTRRSLQSAKPTPAAHASRGRDATSLRAASG